MVSTLNHNFTGPHSMVAIGGQQINGTRFTVEEETPVDFLSWYRGATSGQVVPSSVTLWQMSSGSSGTVIASVSPVPDDGLVGWQDGDLPSPVTLSPGITYAIAGCVAGGGNYPVIPHANLHTPDYPFTRQGTDGYYRSSTCASPPDTVGSGHVMYSCGFSGAPSDPGEPPTNLSIENALARWLDEDDAPTSRPGSLPVLSHALLTDPAEGLAAIKAAADTAIAIVEAALGPGGDFVVGTVRTVLEAWHTVLVDALEDTPPTIMGPGNPTIADVMGAIAALPASGGGGFPLTVGDADWTDGTPSSHYGSKIIATDADAYVITITDIGDEGRTARDVDGTTVHWIRGWARVWDGSKHYNPHTDILGPSTVIMSHSRMPGVMVYMPPDVGWDITPYDYTP